LEKATAIEAILIVIVLNEVFFRAHKIRE
jgi:hypothetical protein